MCDPDPAALSELYRELGFNSLLKELLASGAMEKTLAANGEGQRWRNLGHQRTVAVDDSIRPPKG